MQDSLKIDLRGEGGILVLYSPGSTLQESIIIIIMMILYGQARLIIRESFRTNLIILIEGNTSCVAKPLHRMLNATKAEFVV